MDQAVDAVKDLSKSVNHFHVIWYDSFLFVLYICLFMIEIVFYFIINIFSIFKIGSSLTCRWPKFLVLVLSQTRGLDQSSSHRGLQGSTYILPIPWQKDGNWNFWNSKAYWNQLRMKIPSTSIKLGLLFYNMFTVPLVDLQGVWFCLALERTRVL